MTTVEPRTMSGAELKVELGAMGIPPSWFSSHLGVTMRTVVRWFDTDAVPPRVAEAVGRLRHATDVEIERLRKSVDRRKSSTILKTYRTDGEFSSPDDLPATWHRQAVARLLDELRGQGKTVTVEYA